MPGYMLKRSPPAPRGELGKDEVVGADGVMGFSIMELCLIGAAFLSFSFRSFLKRPVIRPLLRAGDLDFEPLTFVGCVPVGGFGDSAAGTGGLLPEFS